MTKKKFMGKLSLSELFVGELSVGELSIGWIVPRRIFPGRFVRSRSWIHNICKKIKSWYFLLTLKSNCAKSDELNSSYLCFKSRHIIEYWTIRPESNQPNWRFLWALYLNIFLKQKSIDTHFSILKLINIFKK